MFKFSDRKEIYKIYKQNSFNFLFKKDINNINELFHHLVYRIINYCKPKEIVLCINELAMDTKGSEKLLIIAQIYLELMRKLQKKG